MTAPQRLKESIILMLLFLEQMTISVRFSSFSSNLEKVSKRLGLELVSITTHVYEVSS